MGKKNPELLAKIFALFARRSNSTWPTSKLQRIPRSGFVSSPISCHESEEEETEMLGIAYPAKPEMDRFLQGVVGVVEASGCESHYIWEHTHQQQGLSWKSGGHGPMIHVGTIISGDEELLASIALLVNEVDGHRILFVEVTSRGVDHEMVRRWLNENLPVTAFEGGDPRKRLNMTDANNFHNILPRGN